jgi:hypothetical protein
MIQLEKEKAYTAKETGAIMKRTPETIRDYIKDGKLQAEKIGNAYYITESAIKDYYKEKERG